MRMVRGALTKKRKNAYPRFFFVKESDREGLLKPSKTKLKKNAMFSIRPEISMLRFFFSRFFARFRSVAPFSLFCVLPVDDVECECGLDLKAAGVSIPLFWIMVWDSGMKSRSLVFLCFVANTTTYLSLSFST